AASGGGGAVPARQGRMPLLDVAKGLACALIVGHDLARYGPMPAGAQVLARVARPIQKASMPSP
ncbi:MAG: hypothetical protein U1B84_32425, partial [Variovorax sp.]|nr:hypothetical protein [Variovorax sp.]